MLDMLDGDTATIPETQPAEIPKIDTMPDIAEILEAEEEEFLRERKKEPETAEIPELEQHQSQRPQKFQNQNRRRSGKCGTY